MAFGFDNELHKVCALGDIQKLTELIAGGADVRALIGDRESTLLHIAAEYGHAHILKTLLSIDTVSSQIFTQDHHEGDTPIHIATNNIDAFRILFNAYPSKQVNDLLNSKKRTCLHYAAGKGDLDVVRFLLEVNANKFARDIYGATPFHFAARCGSVPVMKELKESGTGGDRLVDLATNDGRTALHYASWNGQKEAVEWLLNHGASLSVADTNGDTALHWAARNGPSDVLFALLERDADVFAANKKRHLALELALVLHNQKDAAIEGIYRAMKKADSNKQRHSMFMASYSDGATLLHYAAAYGSAEAVGWFFYQVRIATVRTKYGKDPNFVSTVNSKDINGNNPFHWAAMKGNTRVIEALRRNKVDSLAKNNEDRTPLLLSLICNHLEFAENLRNCLREDFRVETYKVEQNVTPVASPDRVPELLHHLPQPNASVMVAGKPDAFQPDSTSFRSAITERSDPITKTWMADIDVWTDTFIDEDLISKFRHHMAAGLKDDYHIRKEMPLIYKALYGREEDTAKFIQKIDNVVNEPGEHTGRTALHWATILKQKEIVLKLCQQFSNALVAHVADDEGKTPLDYATDSEIVKELIKRPDVESYQRKLYRDRQAYVDACNAILVGAALIVTVTFAGWLHPPFNDSFKYVNRYSALRMYWVFNGLSFFFAIATVVAAASAVLPVPYEGVSKAVTCIRNSLFRAAILMALSIVFVFGAFAATGFVVLPRSSTYHRCMISGIVSGGLLCLVFVWIFVVGLYKVHSRPSCHEARPVRPQRARTPKKDGIDLQPYILGTRYDYLPWDDGVDEASSTR